MSRIVCHAIGEYKSVGGHGAKGDLKGWQIGPNSVAIREGVESPRRGERPDPDWVRARCPVCGEAVVSNAYHVGGRGYIIVWECWASLGEPAERTCDYRCVL